MKNISINLIKDIAIAVLIIYAVVIILVTVFYDKLAINKTVSSPTQFEVREEILNEIEKEQEEQETDIVTTYSINGSKLKTYEGTQKSDYNKNKVDPFERYTYIEGASDSNTENETIDKEQNYEEEKSIK